MIVIFVSNFRLFQEEDGVVIRWGLVILDKFDTDPMLAVGTEALEEMIYLPAKICSTLTLLRLY